MSRVCSKCFRGSSSRKLGQDAWTEWEGRRFFFSFPFRFFFFLILFILFYFIFLPSLKLSRNINLIENTYSTCTGYLVIKKQQRTTNEETGETCSIFRFWIWVGRILWVVNTYLSPVRISKVFGGITQNISARRKALFWVSNHATYQPEAFLVWYMHYKVAIAWKLYYNNDACMFNEFREWPSQQTIV